MFIAGPHQLYAAIIRPALTNKGCMYVCIYVCKQRATNFQRFEDTLNKHVTKASPRYLLKVPPQPVEGEQSSWTKSLRMHVSCHTD